MASEIPRTLLDKGEKAARQKIDWYYQVFGKDNFSLSCNGTTLPNWSRSTIL